MKSILVCLFISSMSYLSHAQLYVKVGVGYCNSVFKKNELKTGSYGSLQGVSFTKGVTIHLTMGRTLHKFISTELEANFIKGIGQTYSTSSQIENAGGPLRINYYNSAMKANQLYLIPTLVLHAGDQTTKLYSRTGLMLGFQSNVIQKNDEQYIYGTNVTNKEYKLIYREKAGLGFMQSMGIMVQVSNSLKYWMELSCRVSSTRLNSPLLNAASVPMDYSYIHFSNPNNVNMNAMSFQAGLSYDLKKVFQKQPKS